MVTISEVKKCTASTDCCLTGCPPSSQCLMGGWSKGAVLQLYRALLRAGRHLQYTDRNYYRRAVTREFRRCQSLNAPQEKEDALHRGQYFLNSHLGGLV
ncbi:hypothetical protein SKAU_G00120670 [Synaphobranchus kaupii]|uniref:Complex 1 LYR protein domain-containing protein n=1 Tax=Synaphobranchus kaupii TaxID=118154 RepID=A0A9Q1FNG6_SYNKA|nr:hypothetical protein SKAU_G00120670 [Synaphobranchus kaupii]